MAIRNGKLYLSPSALNLFLECQKCFWLEHSKGIHRPRGIFPSLPGGMDLLIKKYFDKYRNVGKVPPEVAAQIDGMDLFPDSEILNKWRNWRSALAYEDPETGTVLSGMLDDLGLKRKNGQLDLGNKGVEYVVLDYKTRGFDVKEGGEEYYRNQLNCYALLLRENKMPPHKTAYLIYYIPKEVAEKGATRFDVVVKGVEIDADVALKTFRDAVALIKGPMPQTHSECEYCSWGNDFLTD